jgi:hypothetical protein
VRERQGAVHTWKVTTAMEQQESMMRERAFLERAMPE